MVSDNIDNDFHAASMRFGDQLFEIFLRSIVRINSVIITNGVRTTDRTLFLLLPDGMNRHQPKNRDAKFFQAVELFRHAVEVSFSREGPRKDLIDDPIAYPRTRRSSWKF